MGSDSEYTTYGPYAICATLQDEHGKLIADSDWPVLATKLPESNTTADDETALSKPIHCYRCKQWRHKAKNPICPLFGTRREGNKGGDDAPNPDSDKTDRRNKLKDPWKCVEPRELTKPVEIDGKKWYYCTKCQCRATGKVDFYQLSHTDATHNPNWKPEVNSTPVEDPDPTPSTPLRPPGPSQQVDDDLVFTGINLAPVLSVLTLPYDEREATNSAEDTAVQFFRSGEGCVYTVDLVAATGDRNSSNGIFVESGINLCSFVDEKGPQYPSLHTNPTVSEFSDVSDSTYSVEVRVHTVTQVVSCLWKLLMIAFRDLRSVPYQILVHEATGIEIIWMFLGGDVRVKAVIHVMYHWFLLSRSYYLTVLRLFSAIFGTDRGACQSSTKQVLVGFPSKSMILTMVMFLSTFWNGNFFGIFPYYNIIMKTILENDMKSRANSTRWTNNLEYNQIKSKLTFNNNNLLTNYTMNDFGYRYDQRQLYK